MIECDVNCYFSTLKVEGSVPTLLRVFLWPYVGPISWVGLTLTWSIGGLKISTSHYTLSFKRLLRFLVLVRPHIIYQIQYNTIEWKDSETTVFPYWRDPSNSFFLSLPSLHRNISGQMIFEYKIITLEVISASSVVARKASKTHCPMGNGTPSCFFFFGYYGIFES